MTVQTERVGAFAPTTAATATDEAATVRSVGATRALVLASAIILFLLSLYPRVINVGGYLTTDEGNWMGRTALFARALVDGDPVSTYQSGHPGVMTMWASLIGMGPERALALVEHVRPNGLEKAPDYLETLRLARRPFAVLTAFAVVAVAFLTWRLFGAGPGLLVGVLLGLEPFFLAHSVVAHVDSNVTTWITVSILSAIVYFWAGGSRGYLAISSLAAGLAFLSKAPSAFLPLFVPLIALSSLIWKPSPSSLSLWERAGVRAPRLLLDGAIWGLLALAVPMLLWPSFRNDPIWTLTQMIGYTEAVGGSDHENFFMRQPVGDPGPLYYPVALAFRLTPVSMLGLVLLIVGLLPLGRRVPRAWLPRMGLLFAFCLLFVGMMSLAPKKFDRYLLPIFPAIEILAALGFWLALRRLPNGLVGRMLPVALLVVGIAQVVPAALVYPYYLSYYNPVLGGGPAARNAFVVGWGEGLDIVTSYLNAKPNAEQLAVAGFYPRVMSAQFTGTVLTEKQYDAAVADYIVLYVNAIQRDLVDRLRNVVREERPEMVVTINGIEYARLYRVPPPSRKEGAGTEFGGVVRLERTFLKSDQRPLLKSNELNPGDTIELTVRWVLTSPVKEDLVATVQMVDERGDVVGEHEIPIGGDEVQTSRLELNRSAIEAHRIPLPQIFTQYSLLVGVKRPSGEWLPVTAWPERLPEAARRAPSQVVVDIIDVQ